MTREEWGVRSEAVSDAELAAFRERICAAGGHLHLCALGRCHDCGGSTPSCSMLICPACAAARPALAAFPQPGLPEAAAAVDRPPTGETRSPGPAEFMVGFHGAVPEEVRPGEAYLLGIVRRVSPQLGFAVVFTPDAARFEQLAAADPRVRYVEPNR